MLINQDVFTLDYFNISRESTSEALSHENEHIKKCSKHWQVNIIPGSKWTLSACDTR